MRYDIDTKPCKESREWAFKACPFCGEGEDEVCVRHITIEANDDGLYTIKRVREYDESLCRDDFCDDNYGWGAFEGLVVECVACGAHTQMEYCEEHSGPRFSAAEETVVRYWNDGEIVA